MNTTEFVAAVRRTGQLSDNDPTYTSTVILEEATQALVERFAEPVSKLRQGYWLHRSVQTTSASNTNGLYRLPPRAVVQGLELLEVSTDGGVSYHTLNIKTQLQSTDYRESGGGDVPYAYVLEGDCVRLIPVPAAGYSIRMRYYLRPPTLITYSANCRVTAVTATTITVDTVPSGVSITTSTGLDVQDADGSHEVPIVGVGISSIAVSPPYVINLSETIDPTLVSVGDYVRPPDTAVFPMLPKELHRPLADYVAAVILTSKGDSEKAGSLANKANNGIERVINMAQPRIKTGQFSWRSNSYLRNNTWGSRRGGWR